MTADEARLLAGEYVLGTLGSGERAAFEAALVRDASLQALVRDWEERLQPLADTIAPVHPHPRIWRAIEAAAGFRTADGGHSDRVIMDLRRAVRRWRRAALGMGALAAALLAGLAVERTLLLRQPAERFVAAVNRGGDQPALIVTVDLASRTVTVRPVALETPPGKSLELWSVVDGRPPRSMGLVGAAPSRMPADVLRGERPESMTFAVSVEPQGGSPSGAPTGPVVYAGKLVKE